MKNEEDLKEIAVSLGLKSPALGTVIDFEAVPETMEVIGHLVGDHLRLLEEVKDLRDDARELRAEVHIVRGELAHTQREFAACRNLFAIVLATGPNGGLAIISKLTLLDVRDSRLSIMQNSASGNTEIFASVTR